MMKKLFFIVLVLILCGCRNSRSVDVLFVEPINNQKTEVITSIFLDTLTLDAIASSYVGDLKISLDTIYFIDSKFCWVFSFDKDGRFLERKLGQGRGPNEISTGNIDGSARLNDGNWIFMGSGNDCHIFNAKMQRQKAFTINKGPDSLLSYSNPMVYTLFYSNLIMKNFEENLYYNVYTEAPTLNFFENAAGYFRESKIITALDMQTGRVKSMLGGYPALYAQNSTSLRLFNGVHFDIDNAGNFFVSYEADSLIYCYDKSYAIQYAFGYKGRAMSTDHPQLSFEDFLRKSDSERKKYGYNTGICVVDDLGVLFRTYRRNSEDLNDGMQIYRQTTLIGDVDVPKNFKVLGYIAPYVYASFGIDEDLEIIHMCKFEIDI